MRGDTIILHVIYEEGEKDSYERVEIHNENVTIQFHCGDVEKDFHAAKKFLYACNKDESIIGKIEHMMFSSSVDHFIQDNEGCVWGEDDILGDMIVKKNEVGRQKDNA